MVRIPVAVLTLLIAVPALAQSPYVAGTIGADISRFTHTEINGDRASTDDSEVLSGSIRAGTSIGANWGVELAFVRTGRSDSQGPQIYPLPLAAAGAGIPAFATITAIPLPIDGISIPIPIDYRLEVRRRRTDLDTVVWARQEVSNSVDLVYLAGIAFSRERSDLTQTIAPALRVPPTTFRTRFVQYSTHPLVGMEARIGLTTKLRLIPGFRLQGLSDGWLMQPSVGVGWFF